MRNRKYHVYLTSEEKRLLLNALIDERNILIFLQHHSFFQ